MKEIMPFLTFDGNCREAMLFYKECFEGELFLLPLSESPGEFTRGNEAAGERIMHATITTGSVRLMGADTMPGEAWEPGSRISVMLQCESVIEIERVFAALGEGGAITVALQDTFWGSRFGMLVDRFGVQWRMQVSLGKVDLGL